MTRVVLDTNIIVSAVLKADGNEALVLGLVAEGALALSATPAILAEYEDVLFRPSLRLGPKAARRLLAALYELAVVVNPAAIVAVSPHEEDNRFLECAETVEAEFLVADNARHFPEQ